MNLLIPIGKDNGKLTHILSRIDNRFQDLRPIMMNDCCGGLFRKRIPFATVVFSADTK